MRIVLHIGRHKTGTTAIQAWFADRYEELLRSRKVLYPRAGRSQEDRDELRNLHHGLILPILDGDQERSAELLGELREEIERTRPEVILLSSEVLSRETLTRDDFHRLRSLLPSLPTQIVVYLRRQGDVLTSRYAERVKRGYVAWPATIADVEADVCLDYLKALEPASDVYGRENLVVRSYDLERDNIVAGFLAACGLDVPGATGDEYRRNVRPAWSTIELLRLANGLPSPVRARTIRLVRRVGRIARSTPLARWLDRPIPLKPAERDRIIRACESSNREVEKLYFGGREVFPRAPFRRQD